MAKLVLQGLIRAGLQQSPVDLWFSASTHETRIHRNPLLAESAGQNAMT
jgi:hypothetical protein